MDLNDFTKDYLRLGLRIGKHFNGYVEHYYGPPEIKKAVDAEKSQSPDKLMKDCNELIQKLNHQSYEEKRSNFLEKTLRAIKTTLRKLNGEKLPYLELVENLFDFQPKLYDDNYFYNLSAIANSCYIGMGTLSERMNDYARRRTIPLNNLKPLFIKALGITQKRTKEIFPKLLPDNENVMINEVRNQKWSMYNWYLGNYQSRIEINIDRYYTWSNLLYFASHEAYPGHHSERVLKEKFLVRLKGYYESSILLIYSPEMVISEGIGSIAENVLFEPYENSKILLDNFCQNPQAQDRIDLLIKQIKVRRGFSRFESNLAYHKYVDFWTNNDLINYAKDFEVFSDDLIKAMIQFLSDELWAPYTLAYQGERLITEKYGERPSPNHFRYLLTEQVLPSDLI